MNLIYGQQINSPENTHANFKPQKESFLSVMDVNTAEYSYLYVAFILYLSILMHDMQSQERVRYECMNKCIMNICIVCMLLVRILGPARYM